MDMVEAEASGGAAGQRSGKTTRMSLIAATEQWERNKDATGLRNENSEPVSSPGDWKSRMEGTVRLQAHEVTQLHQTIDRMARVLEARAARQEAQWRSMKEWLEDREMKCDDCHRVDVLLGGGIADITSKMLAKVRVGEPALTQEGRKD